ncbi:MAG: hypothetical protein GEU28_14310 [Dehalococcoidia bacterium]|nr:hypothetical protein [Dehalococcoidia bacterium]
MGSEVLEASYRALRAGDRTVEECLEQFRAVAKVDEIRALESLAGLDRSIAPCGGEDERFEAFLARVNGERPRTMIRRFFKKPFRFGLAGVGALLLGAAGLSAGGFVAAGGGSALTWMADAEEPGHGEEDGPANPGGFVPPPEGVDIMNGPRSVDLVADFKAAVDASLTRPELAEVSELLQRFEVAYRQDIDWEGGGTSEHVRMETPESHNLTVNRQRFYESDDLDMIFPNTKRRGVERDTWPDGAQAGTVYRANRLEIVFVKGDTVVRIQDSGLETELFNAPTFTLDQLRIVAQAMSAQIPLGPPAEDPADETLGSTAPAPVYTQDGPRSQDLARLIQEAVGSSLNDPALRDVREPLEAIALTRAEDIEALDGTAERVFYQTPERHLLNVTRSPHHVPLDPTTLFAEGEEVLSEEWADGTQAYIVAAEHGMQMIFAAGGDVINLRHQGPPEHGGPPLLTVDQFRLIGQAIAALILAEAPATE